MMAGSPYSLRLAETPFQMGSAPIVLASTRSVVFHSSLHTRLPGCLPFESLAAQGLFFIRPFSVVSPINIDILGRHYRDLTPVCTVQVFLRDVEACIQGLGLNTYDG